MLIKEKKKIFLTIGIIILLPIIIPMFYTIIDIIVNLGRYFGTLSRYAADGICCR